MRKPPNSGPGAQEHLYLISGTPQVAGGTYYIQDIWRVPKWLLPGRKPIVEYGNRFWPRHYKSELVALLQELKTKQYDNGYPVYKNRAFNPKKDPLRDYILSWE